MKTKEQETSDPTEIIGSLKKFYSSLYKRYSNKTEEDYITYPRNIDIPQLTDDERIVCEGKLTKMEIWNALNSVRNNKRPGNDGLSIFMCAFSRNSLFSS